MNQHEAIETLTVLGANWPKLLELDPVGIELWHRNAFRYCSIKDRQAVVDGLVASMSFQPRPADWVRVHEDVRRSHRRERTEVAALPAVDEPQVSDEERRANIRRLRRSIEDIAEAKRFRDPDEKRRVRGDR